MNRVTKRTWLMGLFLMVLIAGMTFFLWEYAVNAETWATSAGSPHLYNNGNIGCGVIYDRDGKALLDMNGPRSYSDNEVLRASTVHWLGDRNGFISAGAVSHYVGELSGFDLVNGVYNYSGIGGSMKLTLSSPIQEAAYAAMEGHKGSVAVYNYKTGEILCAVTTPSFDPDNVPKFTEENSEQYEGVFLNRFLQSSYVPGSIFKVVTTAAALDCVPDIEERFFTCTGKYTYGSGNSQTAVTCMNPHGRLSLSGALRDSCNCVFAQVAELIGRKKMTQYVEQFGVVAPVAFDGVRSVAGNYDNSNTGGASFAWSCIGQHTDLVNPAGFMTFMGAVASGGQGVKPYLVSQVRAGEDVTYRAKTEKMDRIMSKEVAEKLTQYMRKAVQQGYGDDRFPDMQICGKTGTSEVGGGKRSNAMFAGFVLDEKYPLAFIVAVENGGFGGVVSIPIASVVLGECKRVLDGI